MRLLSYLQQTQNGTMRNPKERPRGPRRAAVGLLSLPSGTDRDELAELAAEHYLVRDDALLAPLLSPSSREQILMGPGDLRGVNQGQVPKVKWARRGMQ
jgi:hypothetical protein